MTIKNTERKPFRCNKCGRIIYFGKCDCKPYEIKDGGYTDTIYAVSAHEAARRYAKTYHREYGQLTEYSREIKVNGKPYDIWVTTTIEYYGSAKEIK